MLLKVSASKVVVVRLCEKTTSTVCFIMSGLKSIFHLFAQVVIISKSSFSNFVESWSAMRKMKVASENILMSESTISIMSLM